LLHTIAAHYCCTPLLHTIAHLQATASAPQPLLSGMNTFLSQLGVTFRRDPTNFRPRINKRDSVKDREQKQSNNYFFMGDDE
jgi:ATP-binding cassette subfamily E protein 1